MFLVLRWFLFSLIAPGVGFWRAGKPHLAIAAQLALLPLPVSLFLYSFSPFKFVWLLIFAVLFFGATLFVQAAVGSLAARKAVARWPAVLGFALGVLAINQVVIRLALRGKVVPFTTPSEGMKPTLIPGDHFYVLTDLIRYPIERGSVIVHRDPEKRLDYVQRVVAVGGDLVAWDGETLTINGTPLQRGTCEPDEPTGCHTEQLGRRRWRVIASKETNPSELSGSWSVPEGHVFAVGDNRNNSLDSRYTGAVPLDHVKGVARVIHFSWPTLSRIGRPLDLPL